MTHPCDGYFDEAIAEIKMLGVNSTENIRREENYAMWDKAATQVPRDSWVGMPRFDRGNSTVFELARSIANLAFAYDNKCILRDWEWYFKSGQLTLEQFREFYGRDYESTLAGSKHP